jgi:hypothetical protein
LIVCPSQIPYNFCFSGYIMEAEQLNLIGKRLQDIDQRTADLRRYL